MNVVANWLNCFSGTFMDVAIQYPGLAKSPEHTIEFGSFPSLLKEYRATFSLENQASTTPAETFRTFPTLPMATSRLEKLFFFKKDSVAPPRFTPIEVSFRA